MNQFPKGFFVLSPLEENAVFGANRFMLEPYEAFASSLPTRTRTDLAATVTSTSIEESSTSSIQTKSLGRGPDVSMALDAIKPQEKPVSPNSTSAFRVVVPVDTTVTGGTSAPLPSRTIPGGMSPSVVPATTVPVPMSDAKEKEGDETKTGVPSPPRLTKRKGVRSIQATRKTVRSHLEEAPSSGPSQVVEAGTLITGPTSTTDPQKGEVLVPTSGSGSPSTLSSTTTSTPSTSLDLHLVMVSWMSNPTPNVKKFQRFHHLTEWMLQELSQFLAQYEHKEPNAEFTPHASDGVPLPVETGSPASNTQVSSGPTSQPKDAAIHPASSTSSSSSHPLVQKPVFWKNLVWEKIEEWMTFRHEVVTSLPLDPEVRTLESSFRSLVAKTLSILARAGYHWSDSFRQWLFVQLEEAPDARSRDSKPKSMTHCNYCASERFSTLRTPCGHVLCLPCILRPNIFRWRQLDNIAPAPHSTHGLPAPNLFDLNEEPVYENIWCSKTRCGASFQWNALKVVCHKEAASIKALIAAISTHGPVETIDLTQSEGSTSSSSLSSSSTSRKVDPNHAPPKETQSNPQGTRISMEGTGKLLSALRTIKEVAAPGRVILLIHGNESSWSRQLKTRTVDVLMDLRGALKFELHSIYSLSQLYSTLSILYARPQECHVISIYPDFLLDYWASSVKLAHIVLVADHVYKTPHIYSLFQLVQYLHHTSSPCVPSLLLGFYWIVLRDSMEETMAVSHWTRIAHRCLDKEWTGLPIPTKTTHVSSHAWSSTVTCWNGQDVCQVDVVCDGSRVKFTVLTPVIACIIETGSEQKTKSVKSPAKSSASSSNSSSSKVKSTKSVTFSDAGAPSNDMAPPVSATSQEFSTQLPDFLRCHPDTIEFSEPMHVNLISRHLAWWKSRDIVHFVGGLKPRERFFAL